MDIKDRIRKYLEYRRISPAEFERNAGLSKGYMNNIKGSIGADKINKIVSYYSEINLNWLINGDGEMLIKQVDQGISIRNIGSGNFANAGSTNIATEAEKLSLEKEVEKLNIILESARNEIHSLRSVIEAKNELIEVLKSR